MKGEGVRRIADYLNIIEVTEECLKPGNAYNLAEYEAEEYQARQKQERERLLKGRKRAQEELRRRLEEERNKEDAEKMD